MCAHGASATSTAFCPVVSPFTKSACLGGCCFSSGKCTSSSCAISGIGKEVSNTICYGLNPAIAIGASPNCRGLACKLAVPGCTSDLLGGSCVGTVVDLAGTAQAKNPAGAALVGYPCLDVTPSDKTLTKEGTLSTTGEYVAKLWSICDCKASTAQSHEGLFGLPKFGRLNVTDIKSLVDTLKPGGNHSFSSILDSLKSKIPPFVVPEGESPTNLSNAIGLIGHLVGKGQVDGQTTPMGSVLDLIKGASAVAAASNSTNPLGSLLGALAPKNGDKTNPLAGLGNLVTALSPAGADATEKSDVLSSLLSQLSSGGSTAPSAELIGAVSKILAGAGGDSPAANLAGMMSKVGELKGKNSTELVKKLMAAVSQGKEAANGKIDLAGILSKAQQFVTKADGTQGANPAIAQILASVQALAAPGGEAGADGNSPMAFLSALSGGEKNGTSMQGLLDMAAKAGPLLQQLSAKGGGGAGLSGLMANLKGAEGGEGGMSTLMSLAGKLGPVLQSLNTNANGMPGSDPLAKMMSAVNGAGGSGGGVNWRALADAAQKAAPMVQALTKATGGANPNMAGLQAFLDKVSGPKATA
jgi:hypothetical protein